MLLHPDCNLISSEVFLLYTPLLFREGSKTQENGII